MNIIIDYEDGSTVRIPCVQRIRLCTVDSLELNTFGNEPVMHRNVKMFTVVYDRGVQEWIAQHSKHNA